jgi:hypothetical protein
MRVYTSTVDAINDAAQIREGQARPHARQAIPKPKERREGSS